MKKTSKLAKWLAIKLGVYYEIKEDLMEREMKEKRSLIRSKFDEEVRSSMGLNQFEIEIPKEIYDEQIGVFNICLKFQDIYISSKISAGDIITYKKNYDTGQYYMVKNGDLKWDIDNGGN